MAATTPASTPAPAPLLALVHHDDPAVRADGRALGLSVADTERSRALTGDAFARFIAGRVAIARAVRAAGWMTATVAARCATCGGPHGVPRFDLPRGSAGTAATRFASVSHVPGMSVAAVAASPIGVDAESRATDAARIAAITSVTGTVDPDPLRHWTRVEAVLKADGRGLTIDPSLVRIDGAGTDTIARIDGEPARYRVRSRDRDGLVVSTATLMP